LSGFITSLQNLTGTGDAMAMVTYKAIINQINTKGFGDKEVLKIIKDSHSKALATYLDVLVNGGVDMGVALSEVTNTKEGSPRVRYMENERKKILKRCG
jgi:hypothetical protein